jgi:phosphopantothenate synthetase
MKFVIPRCKNAQVKGNLARWESMALKTIAASTLQAHDPIISVNGTSSKLTLESFKLD